MQLSDAALYERNPKDFAEASARLVGAQTSLASMEERWLELEMRREDVERQ